MEAKPKIMSKFVNEMNKRKQNREQDLYICTFLFRKKQSPYSDDGFNVVMLSKCYQ